MNEYILGMKKLTADTITDEQLESLRDDANDRRQRWVWDLANAAIEGAGWITKREARARCAEILNARKEQKR